MHETLPRSRGDAFLRTVPLPTLAPRRLTATALGILLTALGCAGRSPVAQVAGSDAKLAACDFMGPQNRQRLEALATEREHAAVDQGYRIGPDDLLELRIPDLVGSAGARRPRRGVEDGGSAIATVTAAPVPETGVRVDALGDITVPLIGRVRAAGMTPSALEEVIGKRLVADGYLTRPQVGVLVAEHRSRVVAVVGSVERPGLYPLTRPGATLADLIWTAGGPSKDAGRVVTFVPAGARVDGNLDPGRPGPGEPICLELEVLLHAAGPGSATLNPPVRPNDLINIAPAGSVQVDGWVDKPGSYPVTRALTVSGAVAAAGGHLFPADRRHVTVTRTVGPGEQRSLPVDLASVADGRVADFPVLDGDVVHVPYSPARLVPYSAWAVVRALVHVGGSVALF